MILWQKAIVCTVFSMIRKNFNIKEKMQNRRCKFETLYWEHSFFYNNFNFFYVFNLNEKNKTYLASFQNNVHISSESLKICSPLKWCWKINNGSRTMYLCFAKRNSVIRLLKKVWKKGFNIYVSKIIDIIKKMKEMSKFSFNWGKDK